MVKHSITYVAVILTMTSLLMSRQGARVMAFVLSPSPSRSRHCWNSNYNVHIPSSARSSSYLLAKGFGKKSEKKKVSSSNGGSSSGASNVSSDQYLTSIQSSDDAAIAPSIDKPKPAVALDLDPSLTPDERQEMILRKQFGLTKPGESKDDEWVPQSQSNRIPDEDKDIFSLLPAPLLIAFDKFLKAGLAICTVVFMAAGVLITIEAWQAASGDSSLISPELDSFVVNTVEPNFTLGLVVLLGFSITLGVFTIASGGSSGSQYRE